MEKKFNMALFEEFLKAARIPWKMMPPDRIEIGDDKMSVTVKDRSCSPVFFGQTDEGWVIDYINHNDRQSKRFCNGTTDLKKVGAKLNEAVALLIQKGVTRTEVSK